MYAWPLRIFGNCAVRFVLFPSGKSHFPRIVPPTPVANGVLTTSFGLLSLNGAPKNPQTTEPLVVGVTVGDAWTCAAVRLSLISALCVPVKSMLKIVAEKVIAVFASLIVNVAKPNDSGLKPAVVVVGCVAGFS